MSDIVERLRVDNLLGLPGAGILGACREAADEIESLRQQLAEKDAEIAQLRLARDMLYSEGCEKGAEIGRLGRTLRQQAEAVTTTINRHHEQLAASQAREQQLRAGIEAIQDYAQEVIDRRVCEYGEDFRPLQLKAMRDDLAKAQEALALPQDTAALEAMIAKAGEVATHRAMQACSDLGAKGIDYFNYASFVTAIRALQGVTLEDIK